MICLGASRPRKLGAAPIVLNRRRKCLTDIPEVLLDLTQERLIVATLEMFLDRVTEAVWLVRETGTLKVFIHYVGASRICLPDPVEHFEQMLLRDLFRVCCHLSYR